MAIDDSADKDTSNTSVKVYIPQFQKELWKEDAESLDMSLSEFIRSMVQAGRQDIVKRPEAVYEADQPRPPGLKNTIESILAKDPRSLSDLADELPNTDRDDVASSLADLRNEGRIQHDPILDKYVREER